MTESSPCVLLTPLDAKSSKDGSVGKLLKGTEARVVSLNTGADQPAHESGELLVRGPQVSIIIRLLKGNRDSLIKKLTFFLLLIFFFNRFSKC